jgi:Sigma-70, region 4
VLLLTEEPLSAIRQKVSRFDSVSFNSRESLKARERKQVHLLRRAQALKVPWPAVVEQAVAYCLEFELGLLVVDTFDKWTGLRGDDENKTGAILHALEPLAQATAANLAPFLITHHRKSGGQFGEAVRGGNALVGWADIVIEIDRLPASLDATRRQRLLSCIGRFEEVPERVVELEENAYVDVGDVEEVRADHERGQLLEAVRDIGQPATSAEIAEALNVTESTVRSRLHAAMRRGDLVRSGAGKKGDPFRWAAAVASAA